MNFISTFDELNKLYEEAASAVEKKNYQRKAVKEPKTDVEEGLIDTAVASSPANTIIKSVTGLGEDIEADEEIEIIDDEATADNTDETLVEADPKQIIIECSKCGAPTI